MIEKVILVGVETNENYRTFESSLKELERLTQTANGEVIATLIQKRPMIDRKTVIGKGKLQELEQLVIETEADTVIINQELTPRQAQLLQENLEAKLLDRVQLILDIFASRAQSKAGQLQVAYAQFEYLLPRLTGQGQQLSRLGGGIGTRGPGETKLETDRRHILRNMQQIKKELKQLVEHRKRNRQKRADAGVFRIGLVGYTNAGKSTLLNALTKSDSYAEDQLFATLDPLTRKWQLPSGFQTTLTDTVGFIQDLPTQLVAAFRSTLEESREVDLLLHVVDASEPDMQQQEQTVLSLLKELEMEHLPRLTIYNKIDQVDINNFTPTLFPNCQISAKRVEDLEVVGKAVEEMLPEILPVYEGKLPVAKAFLLGQLRQDTFLQKAIYNEEKECYFLKGYGRINQQILKDGTIHVIKSNI